jgi:hypothetical protein
MLAPPNDLHEAALVANAGTSPTTAGSRGQPRLLAVIGIGPLAAISRNCPETVTQSGYVTELRSCRNS